jgi:hypothetical protein
MRKQEKWWGFFSNREEGVFVGVWTYVIARG